MRARTPIALLAVALCAGCASKTQTRVVTVDDHLSAACGYYSTTLAVALLAGRPTVATKLTSKEGRDAMHRAVGIADRTTRLLDAKPALAGVARPFHEIVRRLDNANAALERDDLDALRAQMRSARAPLVAADAAAKRSKLVCRVTSADGSASVTMR